MFNSPSRAKTHRPACREFASRLFVFTSLALCLFASLLAPALVKFLEDDFERHDLFVEFARVLRGGGALV